MTTIPRLQIAIRRGGGGAISLGGRFADRDGLRVNKISFSPLSFPLWQSPRAVGSFLLRSISIHGHLFVENTKASKGFHFFHRDVLPIEITMEDS